MVGRFQIFHAVRRIDPERASITIPDKPVIFSKPLISALADSKNIATRTRTLIERMSQKNPKR